MNKLYIIFTFLWFIYWQEQGFFRTTENYYCRKNKGNCKECKAWSCKKGYYTTHCTK